VVGFEIRIYMTWCFVVYVTIIVIVPVIWYVILFCIL